MHLAIDLDDVVVDFWKRVQECYRKEFGEDVAPSNNWSDNPIKASDHFGPDRAYETWWDWWRDRHWLWASCDAIDGAIGGLAELSADGHYLELVTHKPRWAQREATAWLGKWHPRFDRLTFVEMETPKAAVTDADVLVDDKPQNVAEWAMTQRSAVLFTQPWNRDHFATPTRLAGTLRHHAVYRADDWNDVTDIIERLASDGPDADVVALTEEAA